MKKKSEKSNRFKSIFQRRKTPRSSPGGFKRDLIGLLFIALAIILALAIISYDQSDPVGILKGENQYAVQNLLGQFGATISAPLFQWTIGYPIVALPILIMALGYVLLMRKSLRSISRFSILIITWSVFLSVVLAFPEALKTFGNFHNFYPSGFLGAVLAAYTVKIFSKFGAVVILFIILILMLNLTFRLNLLTISIVVHRSLGRFWNVLSKKIVRIIYSFKIRRSDRIKLRYEKKRAKLLQKEIKKDPRYQPSLPSEQEIITPISPSKIEIISQKQDEKTFASEPSEIMNEEIDSLREEIEKSDREKTDSDLGFEIQEAHQEKEVDYDAIIRDSLAKYQFPSAELLIEQDLKDYHLSENELKRYARLLEDTLAQFGVMASVNRVVEGPVITLYEVKPAQGVKINRIVSLADDLALAMRARGIRMIAPIPGKAAIGIEIPNQEPSIVYFKSLVRSETFINFGAKLPLGVGKTISGEVYCADLTKMPHLLMAGATGSGKSVGINTMVASLLYRVPPSDLKFVMIDPKKLELSIYAKLKDHYFAVCPEIDEVVITHPQNAIMILRSVVNEMENRYDKLAAMGVREISHYNQRIEEYSLNGETSEDFRKLPYIVLVIDELADLMLTGARDVEEPITRLAQMARAVGIHLILATQRPSVDIITGLIKANFPARIAYQVATRPDSKVILDMYGAEKLIGNGDMLFLPPGKVKPIRLQNSLITTEEVERIIRHIRKEPKFPPYELKLIHKREKGPATSAMFERDELFEKAKDTVIRYQQGSVSLLQRKLKIGYARAARIIDELEEAGIVGPPNQEGKARDVLVSGFSPDIN
jgi:S-DNA-T family DNA segregation ATPase FtsK/SpoIIIE